MSSQCHECQEHRICWRMHWLLVEKELDLLVAPDGNLEACILVAWTTATEISLVQGRRINGNVTSEINLIRFQGLQKRWSEATARERCGA